MYKCWVMTIKVERAGPANTLNAHNVGVKSRLVEVCTLNPEERGKLKTPIRTKIFAE